MGLDNGREGPEPGEAHEGAAGSGQSAPAPAAGRAPAGARRENRTALIAAAGGVVAALVAGAATVWAGFIQVGGGSSDAAPPPAAPTATVPAAQSSSSAGSASAPAAPAGTTAPASSPKPVHITDLASRGAEWSQGTRSLGDRSYAHSLIWEDDPCGDPQYLVVDLSGAYQRFTATVGVDDESFDYGDNVVGFEVYADRNDDGKPQSDELVASRGAAKGGPGVINAPVDGAPQIILGVTPPVSDCLSPAVWGDAQVS